MFKCIREYCNDIFNHYRARQDLREILDTFNIEETQTEAWKALHGMYNTISALTVEEDAFESARNGKHKKHDRMWLYLQYMVAKGDLSYGQITDALNSYRLFGRMVDVFGMERVGVMLTILPDLWWNDDDRADTGSAGSVC